MLSEDAVTTIMAKRILVLMCLALILIGAGSLACAEEPLSAICAFTPADFTEPGAARLSVTVVNTTDKIIEAVRITQDPNKEGETIGSVEPGETLHFSYDVQITKKMLDAGKVNVTLTYKYAGKTQKNQLSAKVSRVNNIASATLTSRISRTALYEGESTEIEYRLINTGAIAIENAVVSDAAFSFSSAPVTLHPGEEVIFTSVRAFSSNAISTPRADFTSSESQNAYVAHAPSTAIHVTNDNLTITIEPTDVSVSYGGNAHFSITVKNNSLLSYSSIAFSSDTTGAFPGVYGQLKAGETLSVQIETPAMTASEVFPVMLTMREAGGSERAFFAGELSVTVEETPARNPVMYVKANPEGEAPFTITLSGANRDLNNVVLSEKKLGKIKTFLVVKADTETVFSPLISAEKGQAQEFTLSWEENGSSFSVTAAPVLSLIDASSDSGSDLSNVPHASLYAMVNTTAIPQTILIASASLLVVLIASFIIYKVVMSKRRRRAAREAIGRTNKFAPIRMKDTDKENQ